MMDHKDDISGDVRLQGDIRQERQYESPVIRTHKREDLIAKAMPINACTSYDPNEDPV